ncbi:MAG: hypothetical protein PHY30_01480 [Candidatus Pacebacteria bacterium]|nr:hypothetical protein [Candidatus Paceibacterota bacterium]
MDNNKLPFVIISAISIAMSIALFYFLVLPQFEKISEKEKEITDLEYKLENTTNYFNSVASNAEKLDEENWKESSKKVDANFMDGPFFKHNMEVYLTGLVTRSGLYLKDLSIEGASQSFEEKKEGEAQKTSKEVNVSFDLYGDYDAFRGLLELFNKQALVIKVTGIDISSGGGNLSQDGQENISQDSSYLNFKVKGTIPSK